MNRLHPAWIRLAAIALAAALGGSVSACSTSADVPTTEQSLSPHRAGLETAPSYDAEQDVWLSDGWPVPDPDAVFDPNTAPPTSAEVAEIVANCVTARGWDASIDDDTIVVDLPDGQREPYERDLKQCYVDNRIGTTPALH